MKNEKPPDTYRCLKMPLSKTIKQDTNQQIYGVINAAVVRTNRITTKAYMLLRLWVLHKYHNHQEIPFINESTIHMAIKSILKPSRGPKPKDENLIMLKEFQSLYSFELEDGQHLSAILDYYTRTMLTAIENNIKLHFFDYLRRFVNTYFKHLYQEQLKDHEFKQQLTSELSKVKNDLINHTLTSDLKYHGWINQYQDQLLPPIYEKNYHYDIIVSPQRYLKYMIFMNLELEKIGGTMYQFFPLQTEMIPRHIQIDTKSLVELLIDKDKKQYLDHIESHKQALWEKYFKTTLFKHNHYTFDYTIITDGYSASIRFIDNNQLKNINNRKKRMKQGKQKSVGMTQELKPITSCFNMKASKVNEICDFPYIDEVPIENLQGHHIFIDGGKRTLFQMMDDHGKFTSYTNRQRMKETKRLKYQQLLSNFRNQLGITKTEDTLSKYNSKTCDYNDFIEFMKHKLKINELVAKKYQETKFRQYKWYAYLNKKRTEDNMLNQIERDYGKDSIIIMGDWSVGKQMRHFISTPNLGLKRKLKERFNVYHLDEFRTSILHWKTEQKCDHLYITDLTNHSRKMHSILTYQMENQRRGCINRDRNSCRNMKKIFDYYLEYQSRPARYRRDLKIQ